MIVAAWGGNPIAIHTLRPGRSFCLGDEPGDFPAEFPGKPRRRWPIVSFDPETPGVAVPGRGRLEPLDVGETTVVVLGNFSLDISRVSIAADRRGAAAFLATAAVGLLCAGAALAVALPSSSSWAPTGPEAALSVLTQPFVRTEAERELSPPAPEVSPWPTSYLVSTPGTMHCGENEMGRPDPVANGRYGVAGPVDNPDPHIARARGRAPTTVAPLLTLATEPEGADPDTITLVWGRDDALGQDPESQRGQLWGETIASARGSDGSGLAPVEGGLSKRIERLTPELANAPPRLVHAGLSVTGALPPSAIARVMASRFGGFQRCHRAHPLPGRIELRFDVNPAGAIETLTIHGDDVRDYAPMRCLRETLEGTEFASAKLGKTSVIYPLFARPQLSG